MAIKRRRHNRKKIGFAARVFKYGSIVVTVAGTVLVAVLVTTMVRWLGDTDNFPITKVNVEGGFQNISPEQVRAAVTPFVGSGFFQLDVESIKGTLGELPWVDTVMVRKVWPDTLFVRVKEQSVLARWGDDGLLNRRGEAFYPEPSTIDVSLSVLTGPAGSEKLVADHYKTTVTLLRDVDVRLARLHYTARGAWRLEFDSGQTVMLGRENVRQRAQRLAVFYRELEASKPDAKLLTVDMRYDNGIAVQWQQAVADCDSPDACQHASVGGDNGELVF